jgi:hypothetical protein
MEEKEQENNSKKPSFELKSKIKSIKEEEKKSEKEKEIKENKEKEKEKKSENEKEKISFFEENQTNKVKMGNEKINSSISDVRRSTLLFLNFQNVNRFFLMINILSIITAMFWVNINKI